jgi:hypothetical protein
MPFFERGPPTGPMLNGTTNMIRPEMGMKTFRQLNYSQQGKGVA